MKRTKSSKTSAVRKKNRSPKKPATMETVETTRVVVEPHVEIRRAATLAQALTEPAEVVVKPETKSVRRTTRRRAA